MILSVELLEQDIERLKEIRRAINKTAYYGGLGLRESGRWLGVMDRLLKSVGVDPDAPCADESRPADARGRDDLTDLVRALDGAE